VRRIDEIAAEHPDEPLALFERAGARDSTGDEAGAEQLYRAALAAGLPESERAQCVIQLASTVRNLGRPEESLELL
ncbi:tetratricopeptide repeat protein, partial [Schumannella luteola]